MFINVAAVCTRLAIFTRLAPYLCGAQISFNAFSCARSATPASYFVGERERRGEYDADPVLSPVVKEALDDNLKVGQVSSAPRRVVFH